MTPPEETFPKRLQLWHGAILRSIAHAVWTVHKPDLSYEVSWEKRTYLRQDSEGTRGAIIFARDYTLGAFFDEHSPRSPFRPENLGSYDPDRFLARIPDKLLSYLQGEVFPYLVEEYEQHITPAITSAFWSEGETLAASESWAQVFKHGAHLIEVETLPQKAAFSAIQSNYGFSTAQMDLVRSLFTRRVNESNEHIYLNKAEYSLLTSDKVIGLRDARKLFEAINVYFP